ncbi:hypothetical protein OR1_02682 [Geobacter sp. OR-1]|uniref:hypothetical protein n=1 Tax=Geobacter sp. OR-1 TaxID=1266765 RepID=UPI000542241B|nr:hypothetical protein [Geobacter sp. OR-1]GAM10393.1 hypothetical protein OR1_02682 [Geobacter sp. OR-1]
MKVDPPKLKIKLYISSGIVFLIGMSTSIGIYLTAQDLPESVFYDYEHSKRFRHEMEAAGGKLNMLLHEMSKEFLGLWEGKNLAYTVAAITCFAVILIIYAAVPILKNRDSKSG